MTELRRLQLAFGLLIAAEALFAIFGLGILMIEDTTVCVPLSPPRNMSAYLEQQIWIDYSGSTQEEGSSSKPWYYLSTYMYQDRGTGQVIYVSRPPWWQPLPGLGESDPGFAVLKWGGNRSWGWIIFLLSVVLLILWIIRFPTGASAAKSKQ